MTTDSVFARPSESHESSSPSQSNAVIESSGLSGALSSVNGSFSANESEINHSIEKKTKNRTTVEEKPEGIRREGHSGFPSHALDLSFAVGVKRARETSTERGNDSEAQKRGRMLSSSSPAASETLSSTIATSYPLSAAPVASSPHEHKEESYRATSSPMLSPSLTMSASSSMEFRPGPSKTLSSEGIVKGAMKSPVLLSRGSPLMQRSPLSLSPSSSSIFPSSTAKTPQQIAAARAVKWGGLLLPFFLQERDESQKEALSLLCQRIAAAVPGEKLEARDHFMTLLASLKDPLNVELREKLVSGAMPVEVLMTLSEKELANPDRRKEMEEGFKERSKDTNLHEIANALKTTSTLFPCPNCKARDCSWVQRQTRSGDEPMTVMCSCNRCNHQWRKY